MSVVSPDIALNFQRRSELAKRKDVAFSATWAILQMDPHSREDLSCYLKALTEANGKKDVDEINYILDSIVELFSLHQEDAAGLELDDWEDEAKATPDGKKALGAIRRENRQFMARYQDLKAKAGLTTQKDVAERCGLSVNTVNAIETEKVRPQTRTLQKLADGLGVNMEELLASDRVSEEPERT